MINFGSQKVTFSKSTSQKVEDRFGGLTDWQRHHSRPHGSSSFSSCDLFQRCVTLTWPLTFWFQKLMASSLRALAACPNCANLHRNLFICFQNIVFTNVVTDTVKECTDEPKVERQRDNPRTYNASAGYSGLQWRRHKELHIIGVTRPLGYVCHSCDARNKIYVQQIWIYITTRALRECTLRQGRCSVALRWVSTLCPKK